MTITYLDHSTAGVYRIKTEGASYYIDFDLRMFRRVSEDTAITLRKDGEYVPLLEFDDIEVGMPMTLWTKVSINESVLTARLTTRVQSIEYIDEGTTRD